MSDQPSKATSPRELGDLARDRGGCTGHRWLDRSQGRRAEGAVAASARTAFHGARRPATRHHYALGVKTVTQGVMELVTWKGRAPLPGSNVT